MLLEVMAVLTLAPTRYCAPVAFRDSELLIGRQALVIVPAACARPALIRERNPSSGSVRPTRRLEPGSVTGIWLFTHKLEYTVDGKKWLLLEVRG